MEDCLKTDNNCQIGLCLRAMNFASIVENCFDNFALLARVK